MIEFSKEELEFLILAAALYKKYNCELCERVLKKLTDAL